MPGAQCRHQGNHISKGQGQETLPEAVVKSAGQGTPSSLLTSQPHCMKIQNTPTVYRLRTVPTAHSHTIVQSHFTPSHNCISHYTVTPHTLPLHSHTLHHAHKTHLTPPGTQTYLTPFMHTDAPHTPCTHRHCVRISPHNHLDQRGNFVCSLICPTRVHTRSSANN